MIISIIFFAIISVGLTYVNLYYDLGIILNINR